MEGMIDKTIDEIDTLVDTIKNLKLNNNLEHK